MRKENHRILIIDDECPILLTLEALLSRHGLRHGDGRTLYNKLKRYAIDLYPLALRRWRRKSDPDWHRTRGACVPLTFPSDTEGTEVIRRSEYHFGFWVFAFRLGGSAIRNP